MRKSIAIHLIDIQISYIIDNRIVFIKMSKELNNINLQTVL